MALPKATISVIVRVEGVMDISVPVKALLTTIEPLSEVLGVNVTVTGRVMS